LKQQSHTNLKAANFTQTDRFPAAVKVWHSLYSGNRVDARNRGPLGSTGK